MDATYGELRPVLALHTLGTVAAVALMWVAAPIGTWEPWSLVALLSVLAFLGDYVAARASDPSRPAVRVAATDLAVVPAMVLLGPVPAAAVAVAGHIGDTIGYRSPHGLALQLGEGWVGIVWPIVGGLAFFAISPDADGAATAALLASAGAAAVVGILVNAALVALVGRLTPSSIGGQRFELRYFGQTVAVAEGPLIVAAVAVVAAYEVGGIWSLLLVVLAFLAFLWLLDKLALLSAHEAELSAQHELLAGFQLHVLELVMDTLAERDRSATRHSAAVAHWARDLAAARGCDEHTQRTIHTAGLLHDIGRFVLPDPLLYHEGELTKDERRLIQAHPEHGAQLIRRLAGFESVGELIHHHHERFDGSGYPDGLRGHAIPLGARILAVCEAYDAMTARDSYQLPIAPREAIDEMREHAGTMFDADVVETFAALLEQRDGAYRRGDGARFRQELDLVAPGDRASMRVHPWSTAETRPVAP